VGLRAMLCTGRTLADRSHLRNQSGPCVILSRNN
jgi:hypothetical protein